MSSNFKQHIASRLQHIANVLLLNASFIDNLGLLNGKLGIAIYFYHHARYTGNEMYEVKAGELIDEIYNEIHQNTSVNYADGLSGFGAGIEYMVKNGFIEANTDEVLEEIDKQIYYSVCHVPNRIDLCNGITGCGKYYTARLCNTFNNQETNVTALNMEHLSCIIDSLDKTYDTYFDLLSVIDFLSEAYPLNVNHAKAKQYLDYATDKLETMLYEDQHFGIYPAMFNPLSASATLMQASEKTGKKAYRDRAIHFLNTYEESFRQFLDGDLHNLKSGSLKWSLLYDYLSVQTGNNIYRQHSNEWLNHALAEDSDALAGFHVEKHNNVLSMGILHGYAGIGLALLTLVDKGSNDWRRLIPWYLEEERKPKVPIPNIGYKNLECQNI